jgi:hypothetical protein
MAVANVDYALRLERENPGRQVAVLVPELVERRWYYVLLHNNRSSALKALLLLRGNQRITVINIPWYLKGKSPVANRARLRCCGNLGRWTSRMVYL